MNRAALEHILRAAAAIANEREFVVIGSQAVLGQFPEAPDTLLASIEADLYPRHAPDKSDFIDGAIGDVLTSMRQKFRRRARAPAQFVGRLDAWPCCSSVVAPSHPAGEAARRRGERA
jgi:hypothetical protein